MFRPKQDYADQPVPAYQFQSLFSWMFRPKWFDTPDGKTWFRVSILVLVDVSPEEPPYCTQNDGDWFQSLFSWMFRPKMFCPIIIFMIDSFNPCSRGCFARRRNSAVDQHRRLGFNPCSRGCFARSFGVKAVQTKTTMFQSLFSWMFRPKTTITLIPVILLIVSILVLVDVSPEEWQQIDFLA